MNDLADYERAGQALLKLMELYRQKDGSVVIPREIANLIKEQLTKISQPNLD
jgi:hypothetical protein